MNWLQKMNELKKENQALLNTVKGESRAFTEDEKTKFDNNLSEIEKCQGMITAENSMYEIDNSMNTIVNKNVPALSNGGDAVVATPTKKIYKNFTEQMIDVKNAAETGIVPERLKEFQNATGMSEGVGSDGGFAVQSDFLGMMLESAVKDQGVLGRVDEYQVSGNSNSVGWVDIDESDVSTTVFGGIQVYWASEASSVAASKPKMQEKKLELEKLMGMAYVTYELDADSSFIDDLLTRGFTTAINRILTGAVISGDGVGKPTGILKGSGLVVVPKKSGQTAGTIVYDNIVSMYHRAIDPRSGGWVWIVHPDAHEQLDTMTFPVGTGGVPVYMPAAMTGTIDTLRGLPVLTSDQCSALGTEGDIILADLSDYFMPFKGVIQRDISMHVKFVTAENAYRFIFRVNGRPKTNNQLTLKNSTKKRGKYITLATR